MYELYSQGKNVMEIIRILESRGITNRGKPFNQSTIYHILRQEKYTGIYRVNGYAYDKIYPAIIPAELYNIVRQRIVANQHGKHSPDTSYILKNKIYCGYCGKKISSYTGTSKSKRLWRYYKCNARNKCESKSIKKDTLENIVLDALYKVVNTDNNRALLVEKILEVQKDANNTNSTLTLLTKKLSRTTKALNNLIKAIESGIYTDTTKQRLKELESLRRDLTEKIEIEKTKETQLLTKTTIEKHLDFALKQTPEQLVRLLVKKIIYYNDRIEIHLNYKSTKPDNDGSRIITATLPERIKHSSQGVLFTEYNYSYSINKGRTTTNPNKLANTSTYPLFVQIYI